MRQRDQLVKDNAFVENDFLPLQNCQRFKKSNYCQVELSILMPMLLELCKDVRVVKLKFFQVRSYMDKQISC